MRRAFLLIHNPLAGRAGNNLTRKVIEALYCSGATVIEIFEPTIAQALDKAALALKSESLDAALIAGGDGTVRAMAPLLAQFDIPVGLIPAGTGNVLAHETCQKFDVENLIPMLVSGPEVLIESSRVNGHAFFLMAGVGFDGNVIANLNVAAKQRFGKLAYIWPVIRAVFARPQTLTIEIDGTTHHATWLVATRARHYAGAFVLADKANLRRSGMTAVLFTARSRLGRLMELLALGANRLDRVASVRNFSCKTLRVTSSQPTAAQADGDPIGTTPLDISTGHAPLRLIVPNSFARPPDMKR